MGCAQSTRPSLNSPPPRLEKMKLQNGYVPKNTRHFRQMERRKDNEDRVMHGRPSSGGEGKSFSNGGGGETKSVSKDGGERNGYVQETKAETVDGWPKWLTDNVPSDVLKDIIPKSSDSYIKIDKIGQGTYSNVYKARDRETGKIVALKKVRFDTSEAESVKFMAREIMVLQRLDHPNIIKLRGLATSRMHFSIYLVFDYMVSDLSSILSRPHERLTEPQIKCYMHQLLSGLQHCHERGVLHRDIKASNLLIDKDGMLKIADVGLSTIFDPEKNRPLTSRVVTLWYRAPELLLGSTDYGTGIDLWSAGCLMAEMFAGRPILAGRTEIEQIHIIFKLCGTPSDNFFKEMKLSTSLKPPQTYKSSLSEKCRNFPSSAVELLSTLLALDPSLRDSATSALDSEFFHSSPLACDLSGLPAIQADEDDDEIPIIEKRRHRPNRVRRRSRSQKEKRKKKGETEKEKGDGEEVQKRAETSSLLINPSSRSEAHPNAAKNIINLPSLPTAKKSMINYGLDLHLPKKSASSREFTNLKVNSLNSPAFS